MIVVGALEIHHDFLSAVNGNRESADGIEQTGINRRHEIRQRQIVAARRFVDLLAQHRKAR